jgi:hypothetical protein
VSALFLQARGFCVFVGSIPDAQNRTPRKRKRKARSLISRTWKLAKILDETLGFRNSCAHPSSIAVGESKVLASLMIWWTTLLLNTRYRCLWVGSQALTGGGRCEITPMENRSM